MRYFTEPVNLNGRMVIITGANSGIGYETAKYMVAKGARVIMGCRNAERSEAAKQKMLAELLSPANARSPTALAAGETAETLGARVLIRTLDLASLASVREFVAAAEREGLLQRIDLLILNAGVTGEFEREETADGLERVMASNHFGHFLLTNLLLPHLKRAAEAALASGSPAPRIIVVSSSGHRALLPFQASPVLDIDEKSDDLNMRKPGAYGFWAAYARSKLANILFAVELRKRLAAGGSRIVVVTLHPGSIKTNIGAHGTKQALRSFTHAVFSLFAKTPWQGCQTTLHCALSRELEPASKDSPQPALYYDDCAPSRPASTATDERVAALLWAASERYTGLIANAQA